MLEPHEVAIREFFQQHPEHIPGVRQMPDPQRGGEMELMLDTDAMIAFADWTIATGRGDPVKAKAFRNAIRERYGK